MNKLAGGVVASILVLWLAWISFEVVNMKSDKKLSKVELSIVKVDGKLDTEIERSRIFDARGERSTQIQWKEISGLKDRVRTLEIREGINHP